MSRSLSFGFYILCVLMLASAAFGQRTTRHKLRPATAASAADASADMVQLDTIVAPEPRMLGVNGYDKPLRSRRETFFCDKQLRCGTGFYCIHNHVLRHLTPYAPQSVASCSCACSCVRNPSGEHKIVGYAVLRFIMCARHCARHGAGFALRSCNIGRYCFCRPLIQSTSLCSTDSR